MGKTFVYNTGKSKNEEKQDDLRFTVGIFIDGRLNDISMHKTKKK